MLQKIQATRFEELVEKLKTIENNHDRNSAVCTPSRLGRADRLALATEMQRLETHLDLMHAELERNRTDLHWRGSSDSSLDAGASFDQSQVEMTCHQICEQKILTEIWIAQSRGINTCWQIADRLNRTYRGHSYVTMQPHLTERDLRANREVAAAVTEEVDRSMIDAAFAVATVLNGMGGPQRAWDHEWMTNEQRTEIIGECYRLLCLSMVQSLQAGAIVPSPGVPRSHEEVFVM
jgi:hypothetical protein